MDKNIKRIKKELNKFLNSNNINTKMLFNSQFQQAYDFPISGRTIYRILSEKKNPTITTQEKILKRFNVNYIRDFKGITILENEKETNTKADN